jgi:hypothetical protein
MTDDGVTANLERRAVSLGTAYALDYGLHSCCPWCSRARSPHAFGEYACCGSR